LYPLKGLPSAKQCAPIGFYQVTERTLLLLLTKLSSLLLHTKLRLASLHDALLLLLFSGSLVSKKPANKLSSRQKSANL
jgi:hypothetical protein